MSAAVARSEDRGTTMREAYVNVLLEIARSNPAVLCLDSDVGGLERTFGAELPQQYLNMGIAEANLISSAAGLASAGHVVFVNTMATFATSRAAEQLRLDVVLNHLNVKVIGTHAGFSAGHLGPTHWCLEDLASVRTMPALRVLVPADADEAAQAVRLAAQVSGPVYVRLGRKATPPLPGEQPSFESGVSVQLRPGSDIAILAMGALPVHLALAAHEELARHDIEARVVNMRSLNPVDADAVLDAASTTAGIVTVEEHSRQGGLGGAVAELVTEHRPVPIRRIGAAAKLTMFVGEQEELMAAAGISAAAIVEAAHGLVTAPSGSVR